MELINATKSLCPECLKVIDAQVMEKDKKTYICKLCEQHGYFEGVHPLGDPDHYRVMEKLFRDHLPKAYPDGLVINLNSKCNLNCQFCFARANEYAMEEPSLDEIRQKISGFRGTIIYLSGGEPTLRIDLLDVIREIKKLKYRVVLFTNGKKLADHDFVKGLKASGLDLVILQFDTFSDDQCEIIRGERLVETKLKAIEHLQQVRIPIYLFTMLVKGVNIDQIKKLIEFTAKNSRFIKIINFNPVWEMGRVGRHESMNMSEIFKEIEKGSGISTEDFVEGTTFSYYLSSIYHQITARGGNKHPWCEMRCYILPKGNSLDVFGQIVNLKRWNQHLKKVNRRLQKTVRFKKIKFLIFLPYYFFIKEFISKKRFRIFVLQMLKCLLGSLLFFRKLSFMDFEAASIIVGTFHTALNIDLNLVATCNLYSDYSGGENCSSCLRQILAMREFETNPV
jgi:7,8-dihydro-6-hydroxymethylpterin dimethyltransferase